MVEIYYGRAGTGKTMRLMERARELSKNTVLIVPEQLSLTRENEIHSKGIDNISVLSFSRFANTVFRTLGGTAKKHPDNAMRASAIHLAIENSYSELEYFKSTARTQGFASAIAEAFDDFDRGRLTQEMILSIPDSELSARVKSKYRDMFTLYKQYKSVWTDEYKDPSGDLEHAGALLELNEIYTDTVFMFDGFFGFTEVQLYLISQLILQSPLCIFAFTTDLSGNQLFATVDRAIAKLTRRCDRLSVEVKKYSVGDIPYRLKADGLVQAERHGFDVAVKEGGKVNDGISVFCASNINEELDYIVCKIKNDVLSGKYRYRDIAVISPDASQISHLITAVFEKHGVPVFADTERTLASTPLFAMILSAFDIALYGFEREPVFSFLKTGLCGLPLDSISQLEHYVRLWNIRDRGWKESEWTRNPAGIGEQIEKDTELLQKLNELKEHICSRLSKFVTAVSKKCTGGQLLSAVYELTEAFCVKENLQALAGEFEKRGDRALHDEYSRVYPLFIDLLDSIYAIYGQKTVSLRRFADMFAFCASSVAVESAPARTDEVLFASVGSARAENKKCVYIPRMNQCYIPLVKKQSPLITDADKRIFERHDIPVSLDTQMLSFAAHFDFYTAAMAPSHELILTYSSFSASGDPLAESEYLTYIKNATGVGVTTRADLPRDFFLVSLAGATDLCSKTGDPVLLRAVAEAGGITVRDNDEVDTLSQEIVDTLYSRHLHLSFSGMEEYVYCPFKFFMNRGLKARPLTPVQFNAADIGTFIHKGLEELLSGDYDISTPESVSESVGIISDEYYNTVLADMKGRSRRFDYMFHRAKKTFGDAAQSVAADIRSSDFKPHSFELDISKYGDPYALDGGRTLTLVGSIDRVDMSEDGFAKIVDYKSGSQAFSFEKMYNGLSLQLPVYASAVKAKDPDVKIAAMYYLKVGVPEVESTSELGVSDEEYASKLAGYYSRDGVFSSDDAVTDRLDTHSIKKDRIIPQEQIDRLIEFTKDRIVKTGKEITSGNVAVCPLTSKPCDYCDYKAICGISGKDDARVRKLAPLPDGFLEEAE